MILSGLRKRQAGNITESRELLDSLIAGWSDTTAGVHVTPETAMQVGTVYSCIHILAKSLAQLPLGVFRTVGPNQREAVPGHRLNGVLGMKPNPWQHAYKFWSMAMGHLNLRGKFVAVKVFNNARPRQIIQAVPLHPDHVEVDQDKDTREVKFTYRPGGREPIVYTADQVLYLTGLSLDGVHGLNPIHAQRNSIGLAKATETHGARLFKNGARPGGLLTMAGHFKDDEDRQKFAEHWSWATQGENQHRTAVLEDGMSWEQLGMTSEDAQFLETRKYQAHEICAVFGVPPHMVGLLDRATFSNIEHQSLQFVQQSMVPWLVNIEQSLGCQMLTDREREDQGLYFKFNVDALLRGDTKTRYESYQRGIQIGMLSPNEARAKEDMNPREGGDIYLTPTNMTTDPDRDIDGRPLPAETEDQNQ